MGLAANLFQSVEIRLNGVPLERVGERLPQIDALKTRLNKGKSWLDGVGASVNFWDADHNRRKQHCAINGYMAQSSVAGTVIYGEAYDGDVFGMDAALNQVAYTANDHLLTFTVNGGGALDIAYNQVLRAGDLVSLGATQLEVVHVVDGLQAIVHCVGGHAGNVDVANGTLTHNQFSVQPIARSSHNAVIPKNAFELIWQPPLGFFEVSHAIPPGGDLVCEFTPENAGSFKKLVIESVLRDLNASTVSGLGSVAGDFNVSIDQLQMYVYVVEAECFDDGHYFLDLHQTRCQVDTMATNSTVLTQKNFDVHGNTTALALAFQDQLTGVDSRRSSSKFKIRPSPAAPDGQELLLTRFYLNYNGFQQPCPDFDGEYKYNPQSQISQSQFVAHRYVDNLFQSNGYHAEGGAESLADYMARGMFHYFTWPKDSDEKSTRVNVNYRFSAPFGVGEQHQMLLFSQWNTAFRITHRYGQVDPTRIQEVMV